MPPTSFVGNEKIKGRLIDKIVYFVEFWLGIVGSLFVIMFLVFKILVITGVSPFVVLWMIPFIPFILFIVQLALAVWVHRDAKKLKSLGAEVDPSGMAMLSFFMPSVGLAWYLACRRAEYKKQITTIS